MTHELFDGDNWRDSLEQWEAFERSNPDAARDYLASRPHVAERLNEARRRRCLESDETTG